MRNLLAGEWTKAWTGRGWLILAGCGVLMSVLGSLGYASEGPRPSRRAPWTGPP